MKADRVRKTLRNKIEILRAELRDKEDKILRQNLMSYEILMSPYLQVWQM
jgi:hypothetical protein